MAENSCLFIEIAIWYHTRTTDYEGQSRDTPAADEVIRQLHAAGLIEYNESNDGVNVGKAKASPGLKLYIDKLKSIPLPTKKWIY